VKSLRVFHFLTSKSKTSRVVAMGAHSGCPLAEGALIAVSGLGYCSAAAAAWAGVDARVD